MLKDEYRAALQDACELALANATRLVRYDDVLMIAASRSRVGIEVFDGRSWRAVRDWCQAEFAEGEVFGKEPRVVFYPKGTPLTDMEVAGQ